MPARKRAWRRRWFAAAYLVAIEAGFLLAYARLFGFLPPSGEPLGAILLFFDRFLVEYLIVFLLVLLLINGRFGSRLAAYAVLFVFLTANFVQLVSLERGGEFLSRLAVDNISHVSILIDCKIVLLLGLLGLLILLPETVVRYARLAPDTAGNRLWILLPLVCGLLLSQSHWWIPETIYQQRLELFYSRNIAHASPVQALYRTLHVRDRELCLERFSPAELARLREFGFTLAMDRPFPLIRQADYGTPPFAVPGEERNVLPNLIVFFTEGISARSLSCYGASSPGLTPNLQDFADQSMVVDNYFNHTAATYRGLHGQLCSLYPVYGGHGGWYPNYTEFSSIRYRCLPRILAEHGYETIFLDPHVETKAFVDEMVKKLGFNKVLTAEPLRKRFLGNASPQLGDALSDSQLFRALISLLQERAGQGEKQPLFLGLYNFGTHAWVNPAKGEARFGNQTNTTLNSLHNLDQCFGRFWRYFQASPYAADTILIFTADHCHYPTQPFVDTIDDPTYQRIFVDRIPLIIHDQSRRLPKRFDAARSTSLDFAPTVLHYLGLGSGASPFLGQPLFRKKREKPFSVAAIGLDVYLIAPDGIYSQVNSDRYSEDLGLLTRYIRVVQSLELGDRIWPGEKILSERNELSSMR